jgi:hypothetical protein
MGLTPSGGHRKVLKIMGVDQRGKAHLEIVEIDDHFDTLGSPRLIRRFCQVRRLAATIIYRGGPVCRPAPALR